MSKATILVVEDDPLQRRLVRENLEQEGYAVFEAAGGREALEWRPLSRPRSPSSITCSGPRPGLTSFARSSRENPLITPIIVTAFGNVENAVEAMRQGAYDYIVKPIDFPRFLLVMERALERQKLRREVASLRSSLEDKFSARNFVFVSPKAEGVAGLMAKAARSDATVLSQGRPAPGRTSWPRPSTFRPERKSGPFLAVNIPSLPESLIESELFGAEKGAYTGAHERKIGLFEAASGGTIVLDEIGDLPRPLQVKLLRVLQDREFYRLGSAKPLTADVRIIAATNRDLEKAMAEDQFRPDLYYRLNVIPIDVPPLRNRKDDIPPLVDHFISKYGQREEKKIEGITHEAMVALLGHSFPGNIRELENVIERAVVFRDARTVTLADLPVFLKEQKEEELAAEGASPEGQGAPGDAGDQAGPPRDQRRQEQGGPGLGDHREVLGYKMKTYGLDG